MPVEIRFDGGDQLGYARETATADALVGDLAEPSLHHVQPRTRSWDEVQMEAWMPPQPGFHARVFVGCVVVDDEMQVELRRGLGVDLAKEPDELLMPVAWHAVTDDFAVKHAQGSKQRGRAVALVVVRHRAAAPLLDWQARLGAIKRLDLTFLVDTQDQGSLGRVEIQAHDIVKLLDELLVAADLEGPDQVGLEVVLLPDSLDCHPAETLRLSHASRAPMGRVERRRLQGGFDDRANFRLGDVRNAAGTRRILLQPVQAQGQKPLSPKLHGRPRNPEFLCDVLALGTLGGTLNDPRPLDQPCREAPAPRPFRQRGTLNDGQDDRRGDSHAPNDSVYRTISQSIYGTLH